MLAEGETSSSLLATAARGLLAAPFIYSAVTKLLDWSAGLAEVRQLSIPMPGVVLLATVALQIGGALLLVSGWHARWAAATLAGFTLLATVLAHPVWRIDDPAARKQRLTFSEHLAIVGGLLMVVVHG